MDALPRRCLRSLLATVVTAGLIGLPALSSPVAGLPVSAPSDSAVSESGFAMSSGKHRTALSYFPFLRNRRHTAEIHVRGQLLATIDGRTGAVAGARVSLYRKSAGAKSFDLVRSQRTGKGRTPKFDFQVYGWRTAQYRVVYAGSPNLGRSVATTRIRVYRVVKSHLRDSSGTFSGHVSGSYARRWVKLDRRSCAACRWHAVGRAKTDGTSRFSFKVSAPASGHHWWRVRVKGHGAFMTSYSGTWRTHLR